MNIVVPDKFVFSPFFKEGDCIRFDSTVTIEDGSIFVFEIAAEEGLPFDKPWNKREKTVPIILQMWKQNKDSIASLFRQRKRKEAGPPMVTNTARFLSILFWMNETYLSSLQQYTVQIEALRRKPVNVVERLDFILEQPDHYHSFIQLSELYEEVEKLFEKTMIMKKTHLLD
ncbi:YpoC family protein [Ectobacillus sp. sgz5001026]|uniref:YpoC family protein n=1 Tax=Ectobacillus sp. sgz5001026 TaxID=3242473 RepID=UPI0036D31B78